jgi:hypothetical protein
MDEITEDQMVGLGLKREGWYRGTSYYKFPEADNGVYVSLMFTEGEVRPQVRLCLGDCWAEMSHIQSYRELIVFYHTVTGNVIVTYGLSEAGVKQGVVSIGGK